MLISNLTSRLHLKPSSQARSTREAERLRIKAATKKLRTHAEKMAWHFADMAEQAMVPAVVRSRP